MCEGISEADFPFHTFGPLTHRLVTRLSAGVGTFRPAGHSQYAHALPGVVDVRGGRIPGRRDQRGWAGGSDRNVSACCCSLHGNYSWNYLRKISLMQYWVCLFFPQFPLGIAAAASVRVGNALGAGNIEQAKLSCKVSVVCSCKNKCTVDRRQNMILSQMKPNYLVLILTETLCDKNQKCKELLSTVGYKLKNVKVIIWH